MIGTTIMVLVALVAFVGARFLLSHPYRVLPNLISPVLSILPQPEGARM